MNEIPRDTEKVNADNSNSHDSTKAMIIDFLDLSRSDIEEIRNMPLRDVKQELEYLDIDCEPLIEYFRPPFDYDNTKDHSAHNPSGTHETGSRNKVLYSLLSGTDRVEEDAIGKADIESIRDDLDRSGIEYKSLIYEMNGYCDHRCYREKATRAISFLIPVALCASTILFTPTAWWYPSILDTESVMENHEVASVSPKDGKSPEQNEQPRLVDSSPSAKEAPIPFNESPDTVAKSNRNDSSPLLSPLVAAQALIEGVRVRDAPDHTRLVLDTDTPVKHKTFSLDNPERLVIDVKDARIGAKLPKPAVDARFLKNIRSAPRNGRDLRIVLDLKDTVRAKSFMLKPNKYYGHRLVVDLEEKAGQRRKGYQSRYGKDYSQGARDLVIAIDAGHGGDDPGAKGPSGVYEKDVVLAISRHLARLVNKEPGMRAVMVRTGDYYLGLRKRVQKTRDAKADLFLSIHANSVRDRRVRGSSVYTLSQSGASSEAAQWLAKKENRADLIGGVELADKNDLLASVLLDLSSSATIEASRLAADDVLRQLRRLGKTHKHQVQHAGFQVLKAPEIPSMLVETALISNPTEEQRLKEPNHQVRVAKALLAGIRDYFSAHPPPGTWMAQRTPRKHVISRGDTLSTIAQQYQVDLHDLRNVNRLPGDRIRVGQVIIIPES